MHVLIARTTRGTTHAVSCETSVAFGERFTQTMEVQGCTVERLTLAQYAALRQLPAVPVPKGAPWAEEIPTPAPVLSRFPLTRAGRIATLRLVATGRARRAATAAACRVALDAGPLNPFEQRFGPFELIARQLAVRREFAAHLVLGRPLGDWGTYYLELRAQGEASRAHYTPGAYPTPAVAPAAVAADLPTPPSGPDLAVGDEVVADVIGAATVTHVLTYPDGTRLAVACTRGGEAQLLRPGTFTRLDRPAPAPARAAAPVDAPCPAPKPTVMPSLF